MFLVLLTGWNNYGDPKLVIVKESDLAQTLYVSVLKKTDSYEDAVLYCIINS